MLWCENSKIGNIRERFIRKASKIVPELVKLGVLNSIKYCLVMADSNLQPITAMYIKDILTTYRLENGLKINDNYIKFFM